MWRIKIFIIIIIIIIIIMTIIIVIIRLPSAVHRLTRHTPAALVTPAAQLSNALTEHLFAWRRHSRTVIRKQQLSLFSDFICLSVYESYFAVTVWKEEGRLSELFCAVLRTIWYSSLKNGLHPTIKTMTGFFMDLSTNPPGSRASQVVKILPREQVRAHVTC